MAALKDLLRDLNRALESEDLDQANSVRRTIAEAHPESPEGGEAAYKLGLEALFRQRANQAADWFRGATKSKSPRWSAMARVSLGLVLLRQGKGQQATFELRRVASAKPPSLLTAQAQGFLVIALSEQKQTKEAQKIRDEQMKVLGELTKGEDKLEAAMAHFLLGIEHKFDGNRTDAKRHLSAAITAPELPSEERQAAEAALKEV